VACGPSFSQKTNSNPEKREKDIIKTIDKLLEIGFPIAHDDNILA